MDLIRSYDDVQVTRPRTREITGGGLRRACRMGVEEADDIEPVDAALTLRESHIVTGNEVLALGVGRAIGELDRPRDVPFAGEVGGAEQRATALIRRRRARRLGQAGLHTAAETGSGTGAHVDQSSSAISAAFAEAPPRLDCTYSSAAAPRRSRSGPLARTSSARASDAPSCTHQPPSQSSSSCASGAFACPGPNTTGTPSAAGSTTECTPADWNAPPM